MALAILAAALAPLGSARAQAPGQYRDGEYDLIRNILPPGQTGFLDALDVARHQLSSSYYAPHQDDQEAMYADLLPKAPNITAAAVAADYKDASFGVQPDQVASVEHPHPGVTIIRDRQFGVPHIYGDTDADLVWGTGWVLGEDRLFLTDVLRHYGRSRLASFLGPDRSFIEMDCQQAQLTGYTEAELNAQIARLPAPYPQLMPSYIDGINAYIDATLTDPTRLPAEYAAFGLRPQHFNGGDVIAIAGLVGGIFGKGGGVETRNAAFLRALYAAFGGPTNAAHPDPARARQIFTDFMEANDPAAPPTVDQPFPYEPGPYSFDAPGAALTRDDPLSPGGACTTTGIPTVSRSSAFASVASLAHPPKAMSNALLVDAAHSTSGRPIAVFGPQVAYFEPEILMEEDLHSPSVAARGATFPGTNFIIELGHGSDYAWSATSAGTDNVDQFAERLCNPSSADPLASVDPQSQFYMWKGRCIRMYERTDQEIAPPSPGSTSCPSDCLPVVVTIKVERTVHGPVVSRTTALLDGREVPVAISSERSTFMHEADSVSGFTAFNAPSLLRSPQDFLTAASHINYVFNWFYIDNAHIAYYQSGALPIRAPGVHPDLATWGTGEFDWQGNWDWSTGSVGQLLAFDGHPHAIDPPRGFITSWNNKGAPGFRAADDSWSWGPVHRSQSLDNEIRGYLSRQGGKMSLVDLVNAMESAASVDLRGTQVLPWALALIGDDPSVVPQTQLLKQWYTSGAHRRDRRGRGVYDDIKAVELINAWYPRLLHAIFDQYVQAPCGAAPPWGAPVAPEECDDRPGVLGSAYIEGWYGYAQKALQMALGAATAQPYAVAYCSSSCRSALIASLQAAAADASRADDRATTTADDIHYRSVGVGSVPDMPWQNRPTFQQVVDIPGHRPPEASTSGTAQAGTSALPNTSPGVGRPEAIAAVAVAVSAAAAMRRRRAARRRAGTAPSGETVPWARRTRRW